jgi:hypothetical protein
VERRSWTPCTLTFARAPTWLVQPALYGHSNTVVKRLARVADLLGDNWQSPDRVLELHMALQLRSLADRV